MKLEDLNMEYDKLQKAYGAKELNAIYNGGCIQNPDICFVFMNPTGRNIASYPEWKGIRAPWIGTKNIWDLFYQVDLLETGIYQEIKKKKGKEWTEDFAQKVYQEVEKNHYFITNLGKCTQLDARALPDSVYQNYLALLEKEIELVNPKVIVLFGNQVSSIFLGEKISVSMTRKKRYLKTIGSKQYPCYAVFYPVGNGRFNIDKSIEDICWILSREVKKLQISHK